MLAVINETGIIVVVVALIFLFGAGQIPKAARNLAEARKEFRRARAEPGEADRARGSLTK